MDERNFFQIFVYLCEVNIGIPGILNLNLFSNHKFTCPFHQCLGCNYDFKIKNKPLKLQLKKSILVNENILLMNFQGQIVN